MDRSFPTYLECSVGAAYNFYALTSTARIGHIKALSFVRTGTALKPDLFVSNPEYPAKEESVVAVIESFKEIKGAVYLTLRVSWQNKVILQEALAFRDECPDVVLEWVIYACDADAQQYFKEVYSPKAAGASISYLDNDTYHYEDEFEHLTDVPFEFRDEYKLNIPKNYRFEMGLSPKFGEKSLKIEYADKAGGSVTIKELLPGEQMIPEIVNGYEVVDLLCGTQQACGRALKGIHERFETLSGVKIIYPIGHITMMSFPLVGKELALDWQLQNPLHRQVTDAVAAVISTIAWSGRPNDPIKIKGVVSPQNKLILQEIRANRQVEIALACTVYAYDFDAETYFKHFYTQAGPLACTLDSASSFKMCDYASTFDVSLVPKVGQEQNISVAFGADRTQYTYKFGE